MAALSILIFLLVYQMPGDPVLNLMGERVSEEAAAVKRRELGLDQPFHVQLFHHLSRLATGGLGVSIRRHEPVSTLLLSRLPYTLALAGGAMTVSILLGVLIGVAAGARPGEWPDLAAMFFGLLGISTPVFWFGMMLIFFFSMKTGWLPVGGTGQGGLLAFLLHLILPVLTLGLRSGALLSRYVRNQWMEALAAPFVVNARAKGFTGPAFLWRHLAKPHAGPVLQVIGLDFASYLTGSVVTETLFSWPGLGSLMLDAIFDRDMPVLSGAILLCAAVYAMVLYLVDLLQVAMDARLKEVMT